MSKLRSCTETARRRVRSSRLTADDRRMISRINKTRSVMRYFGMVPLGYDPGVSGRLKSGASISLSTAELNWLQPLLEELRDYREGRTQ